MKCKTCLAETGANWKTQCLSCYADFKGMKRIEVVTGNGVHIRAHPDATKEEIDEFIKKTFGSVNDPANWGAVEVKGKYRLWWNCQNTD